MRKMVFGLFAALSMLVAGAGVSLAPVQAEAQSYRQDRGPAVGRRYDAPRRGYRGYRGGRDYRGYRGRGYRAARRYSNPRAYRSYRDDRRGRAYRDDRRHGGNGYYDRRNRR